MSEQFNGARFQNGSFPTNRRSDLVSAPETRAIAVCLVDDEPSVLKATGRLLSSAGWKVEAFSDPDEFLLYAETNRPKVVVLDILMPIMNGLEVQSRLRELSPSSRVVVVTSKDDPSVRSKAIGTGASAFFLKPVDAIAFLAGVESAFAAS